MDRKKDLIITGGINVYPTDVEKVILELPLIAECAAISLPDDRLGEVVAVALVAKEGQEIDLRTVKFHCAKYLADFQMPAKYFIIDKLPRNIWENLRNMCLLNS